MATITKRDDYRGTGWQVKIRRKGFPLVSKVFDTKANAEAWARDIEREMDRGAFVSRTEADKTTLGDILQRYLTEVLINRKGHKVEAYRIDYLLRDSITQVKASALSGKLLAEFRDRRLKQVSGSTANRDLNTISAAINVARKEWGIHIENPVAMISRPASNKARDRRLAPGEEDYLLAALDMQTRKENGTFAADGVRNEWIKPFVVIAIETAMRRSEILSLDWRHVDKKRRTAHLTDAKNGEARTVPLSSRAVETLLALPRAISGAVFPIGADVVKMSFPRAVARARKSYMADCKKAGVVPAPGFLEDLTFHDLRHEATSRLAEKLDNILELAAVTGHKDLRMLKRYYHPRAEDLAKKLG